jgi:uncharacterized cupredoxin-like copper-binding protein
MKRIASSIPIMGVALAILLAGPALAEGGEHERPHAHAGMSAEQKAFGVAGDSTKVSRTIAVDMTDQMRFVPAVIDVKLGETLRFRITNKGSGPHEMVIGTLPELREHAALMRSAPAMAHSDAHAASVQSGTTEEIVWTFNRPGEFSYACLVPGHLEAGMVGKVVVKARTAATSPLR